MWESYLAEGLTLNPKPLNIGAYRTMSKDKTGCSEPGCTQKVLARGLCKRHYYRARSRNELPETWSRKTRTTSSHDEQPQKITSNTGFCDLVIMELAAARKIHSQVHSLHEGYAIILEELSEFFDEVRKRRSQRDLKRVMAELVQVAAMAQRVAEDVVIDKDGGP